MSLFHYKAYDAAGATITGALEADSLATLEGRLRATGIWLLEARGHGDRARDEKTRKVASSITLNTASFTIKGSATACTGFAPPSPEAIRR